MWLTQEIPFKMVDLARNSNNMRPKPMRIKRRFFSGKSTSYSIDLIFSVSNKSISS